jgi:glycosyltransferase involved in cell wall biosynthesis
VPAPANREVLHYVGYDNDRGGIVAMIRALASTGRFRCLLGVNPGCVQHSVPPLEILELPRIDGEIINFRNLVRAWAVARRVCAWLQEDRARVFHGHSRAGLLVGLWLQLLGERRVVVSVHCYGRQRWFYRLAASILGTRLVWYSPAMKRHYGYSDNSWSGCMPNGLTVPLPLVMHGGPAGGVLRLGGAGAMFRWKRWDLILQALAHLPAGTKVQFTHIGGATDQPDSQAYEQELHAMATDLGLNSQVQWQGWQSSSAELLQQVDAVVVPSDGEPFSMIALEALFAGRPVIATRGGGPEDFIREGENGWLVPQGDAAALGRCIEKCLDPAVWTQLRVAPEYLRKYSMSETLAARWATIYAQL